MAARTDSRQARLTRAREEARLRTAEIRKEEEQLEDLATEFFFVQEEAAKAREDAEKRIAQIRADLESEVAELEEKATAIVGRVGVLRSAQEASVRLGVPVAAATAARKTAKSAAAAKATSDTSGAAEQAEGPVPEAAPENAGNDSAESGAPAAGQLPEQAGSPDDASATQPPGVPA
ncbi:hypothetical protein [Kitasatospora kifunensis]|uniref:Chromosome segregation ATPase n=1 Tax=Kitasatospora kifunensis TaxID=58351 RepID=A0A7W7RBY7_KITKI|nr:hypothetical protein [Kitasatospora kifunensis]MBB4929045.1 chromosome segregation ATPase [Kitasatospora kifunensis]